MTVSGLGHWRLIKVMGLFVLAFSVMNSYVVAAEDSKKNSIVDATVCELVQHSSKFYNKVVRVRARVATDAIEHTVVFDESCPRRGVALWTDSIFRQRPDYRELRSAIVDAAATDSKVRSVRATLTGRFVHRRGGSHSRLALEAEKIDNIEVMK